MIIKSQFKISLLGTIFMKLIFYKVLTFAAFKKRMGYFKLKTSRPQEKNEDPAKKNYSLKEAFYKA